MPRYRVESRETVFYYHEVEADTLFDAECCVRDGHDGMGNQIQFTPVSSDDFEIDEVNLLLPDCLFDFVYRLNLFIGGFNGKIFS